MGYSDFDKRMKKYEEVYRQKVVPHIPIIIRIDGKNFKSYTGQCVKPFDAGLSEAFQQATRALAKRIGGFNLAYGQSDEISIVIYNPDTRTQEYFDGKVFKLCSVIASMFTVDFNNNCYRALVDKAIFDCRVFQLPLCEVTNYFIWRQQDATRNSIQMVGQANFSHKQLKGKSCTDIQDMLFKEKGINWNDETIANKRGWCCYDEKIDMDIPIFTQDKNYIESKLISAEDSPTHIGVKEE